eukprot:GILJ01024827.1.p1 GENE.GILJ01024827.1~~GILJ01024827.1.p1  ORF type:complete len:165 (-),score=18.88 GILJ01024827.1:16-486(-)
MAKGPRCTSNTGISSEKEISLVLESICEQAVILESFPQLYYELNFVVLSSDGGSIIPALCSAACSALLSAGVEMVDIFAATTAYQVNLQKDKIEPAKASISEQTPLASCTVAATTTSGKILFYQHEGSSSLDVIGELFEKALDGCKKQRKDISLSI